jgi:hypothetical protein
MRLTEAARLEGNIETFFYRERSSMTPNSVAMILKNTSSK